MQNNKTLAIFYPLIICLTSLVIFLDAKTVTAFDWPAIDIGAFLERFYDKNFLPHDFFANSSSETNPRHIFAYFVIFTAKFLGNSWYHAFFFLKTFFVLTLPVLFYLLITSFLKSSIDDAKQDFIVKTLIASSIIYVLSNLDKYALAWWPPIVYFPASQTMSMFCGLVAIIALNYDKKIVGLFFFFAATLLHPTIGTVFFIYYFIFTFSFTPSLNTIKQSVFYSLFAILLPYIILFLAFTPEIKLSAAEFNQYYVISFHPSHFLPSQFGTFDERPWYHIFIEIAAWLSLCLAIGIFSRNRTIILSSALSLSAYLGSVAAEYFFVELYPIKFFSMLGICRFVFLGYWLVVCCAAIVTSIHYQKIANFINEKFISTKFNFRISYLIIFIAIANITVYKTFLDDPFARMDRENGGLFSFIKENVEPEAVILTASNSTEILLLSKRSTIASGFPFREDFFKEHDERYKLIRNIENLTREDLLRAKKEYGVRYVLLSKRKGIGKIYLKRKKVFENGQYLMVRI